MPRKSTVSRSDSLHACSGRRAGFAPGRSVRQARGASRSSCRRPRLRSGLKDPFDPLQAIPASAKFLRRLFDQFGNLGLAAAAYNAGGGRIERWLSRRSTLPKETRDYVVIITGHKAEAWTDEEITIPMPTELPAKAPCEGVGGLSRKEQVAEIPVDLTASASAMVRKAEADDAEEKKNEAAKKLRVASVQIDRTAAASRKINGRTVVMASRYAARKAGKRANVRFASASGGRTK